ncbi:MAG: ATPase, T2SS/T4P/T4SS family [Candidatus Omnitrophota bacterium]
MIKQADKTLAEEIVKRKLLSAEVVDRLIAAVQPLNETFQNYLIRNGYLFEEQVLDVLAQSLHLEIVDLRAIAIQKAVIDRVPVKFAWYYKFMPLAIDSKALTLASAAPLDVRTQDEIRVHLGLEPKVVLARAQDVLESLKKHYGIAADTIDRILTKEPQKDVESDVWVEDLEKESQDASVAKLVNQILLDAYQKRATDIHLEPYRDILRLRYRIDGVLVNANLPPEATRFLRPMLSRIKILANLSIEEKRLPQDGSAVVKTKDQDLDLRISTIPTLRGESMVIRILPTKVMLYSLEKLGIDRKNVKTFRELVKKPHGIILVTGPTGSGKTTTLYACLNEIKSIERKIVTIEDPIEFEMEGITQIQVNNKVHFDFARGLRSILRHDPDIIMVGEIRDLETAEIAIRTALTGHLVFSTLHTNDASSGVTRLIDMGLEPFLVASSVEAFIAQRLVRTICPKCKEEVKSPLMELRGEIAAALKIDKMEDVKIFRGRGCAACNQTGYLGRTALCEILTVNEAVKKAILEKKRTGEIKRLAVENGMRTLRQEGWLKVLEGVTTPEEVMDVTVSDEPREDSSAPSPSGAKAERNPKGKEELTRGPGALANDISSDKNEYDSRVYPRAFEKIDMRFQIIKKDEANPNSWTNDGIEHSTTTQDISAGGVRFILGNTIPAGTILAIKIQLKPNERSVNCMAKVCRVEEHDITGRYYIVAYYLDISSADRVRISSFVRAKLDTNPTK